MKIKKMLNKAWFLKTCNVLLQKIFTALVFLFFVIGSFAQKAELQIQLQQPDLQPAPGTITIKGTDTTLIDNNFTGAATYILRDITAVDEYKANRDFMIYPNPVSTQLSIDLPANRAPGVFEAYNLTGNLLLRAETMQGSFTLPAGNAIILLKYTDNDGMASMNKVITNNNQVIVNIIITNAANSDGLKSVMASDDYEVSFADPVENLDNVNWNISVPTGTIHTIDETIAWSQKTVYWEMVSGNSNSTVTAIDIDENEQLDQATTTDGNIAGRSIQKRFDNEKGLNMEYLLIAPYTDTAKITVNQFMNDKLIIDTLRNGHFHLTITGNGENYIIKHNNEIMGTNNIGEESFFKIQRDIVPLELIVTGTGLISDTSYFNMEKGLRTENIQLEPINYSKIINFNMSSSEATKTIKSFRGAIINKDDKTDTLAVRNFTGNTGQLTYNSNKETEEVEVVAIRMPAHEGVKQNMTLTGTHSFNKTATIVYENSRLPILIKGERGLAIGNVSITGFGSAKTTGSDGKVTLEMLLDKDKTDDNGLPFSSYSTTLALASSAIVNQNTDVNHVKGNNAEQEKTVKRNLYPYVVNESISSSNSAKTPLGFRGYILFNNDTLAVANFTGVNGQLTFNNSSPTLNAKTGAKNVPYHSDATEKSLMLDGNDNTSFIVNADVNSFNVTGNVKEENTNDPISANVEAEGKNDDTDSNGNYAINSIVQKRDLNNKPRVYSFGIVATGDFDTQNKTATADGTNKTVNFVTPQATFTYWLFDNASSPNGATAKGWKDGELLLNGTVNGGAYETNHENRTSSTLTLDSLVLDANEFVKKIELNYVMTPNGTQHRFNLEEEPQGDHTISIRGKAITLTKERIKNRNNALIIERPDGEKFYFDLDANGEFSGNIITPDTLETIKAYWNTSTMTEFREKTISLNRDNEAYPINRVIAGYFDAYDQSVSAEMPVNTLNDDYLRVYAGKESIVMNDILQFAIKAGGGNVGSGNYWREIPLRPYVYSLLPDGSPVSADDIQDMELVMEQAKKIFYHTETGWTVPVATRTTGSNFGSTPTGLWLMRQIPLGGYWNNPYGIPGEPGHIEGGEARVDRPVDPPRAFEEATGPWIRDGPDMGNEYSFTWSNNVANLTPLGDAHMSITTDFPPGTGKE